MLEVLEHHAVQLPTSTFRVNLGQVIKGDFLKVLTNIEPVHWSFLFTYLYFFPFENEVFFPSEGPERALVGVPVS